MFREIPSRLTITQTPLRSNQHYFDTKSIMQPTPIRLYKSKINSYASNVQIELKFEFKAKNYRFGSST